MVRRQVRLRPVRPAGWWFDGLLLAGFVALTVALARGHLLGVDLAVREWAYAHQPAGAYWAAWVLNRLGQGGWLLLPVSSGLAIAVGLRARSVRPLLLVAAAFLVMYLTVGPLKLWTDRAAPSSTLPPQESVRLFNALPPGEYGLSYPSGHVANAIVWYGVITALLVALTAGRPHLGIERAVRGAPPVILLVTTTYLNYHWLTDGLAGLLCGLVLHRLLARVPWDDLPLPGWLGDWTGPAFPTPAR